MGFLCNAWVDVVDGFLLMESGFTGIILEADYTCSAVPSVSSVTLRSYPGMPPELIGTALLADNFSPFGPSTTDPVLTINCQAPGTCPPTVDACTTGFSKGSLLVKEASGKEKLIAKLLSGPALLQTDMGNPLNSAGTMFSLCIYDDAGDLAGEAVVDRAGDTCAGEPCWKSVGGDPPDGKGYNYKDNAGDSNGVQKLLYKGDDTGKSKALVKGKGANLPTGITAALQSAANATVQLRASDGQCLSVTLSDVKDSEPDSFKAK